MATLQQILIDVNSYLDLAAELPTGDDLDVRINYAQAAVREWADAYQWPELKATFTPTVASLASLALPTNFKELLAPPAEYKSAGTYDFYPQIRPEDRYDKTATDKYSYVLGNESAGFSLNVNGIAANATLSIAYQRHASNMATLSDVCEVPDDQFVKNKVISYVLQSRSDERFPLVEAEAQRLLKNMIGRVQIEVPGGIPQVRRSGAATWRIGTSRGY